MNLSPHFTLTELTVTGTGLPNTPGLRETEALRALCVAVLEPFRGLLAVPLAVTSGFRSAEVNARIGGARGSQHMKGEAADVVPLGVDADEAMRAIVDSSIPYDQVIFYPHARTPFIHVSHRADGKNRLQALYSEAPGGSGGPYHPWPS